jgi:V8-like Glu-specific endopeptidase
MSEMVYGRSDPRAQLEIALTQFPEDSTPLRVVEGGKRTPKPERALAFDLRSRRTLEPPALPGPAPDRAARLDGSSSLRGQPSRGRMEMFDRQRGAQGEPQQLADGTTVQRGAVFVKFDSTAWPARAAVKLFHTFPNGVGTSCSGLMIGAKTVLTAAHCIYRSARGGWANSVRAIPGLDGTYMPFGDATATKIVASGNWVEDEDDDYDWALILLDRNIAETTGHFGWWAAGDSSLSNKFIEFDGYPGAVAGGMRVSNALGVVECTDSTMVYHDATSTDGASGAGMHLWSGPNVNYAVAINTGKDHNVLCALSQMSRATRINGERSDIFADWVDHPDYPLLPNQDSGWGSLGGVLTARVSAVSPAANRYDMFARGLDGGVFHLARSGNAFIPTSGWESLGGKTVGTVGAVSRAANQIDIFARGYGEPAPLCSKAWNGSAWSPGLLDWWCFQDTQIIGSPSAVSTRSDRLHVFARDAGNKVVEKAWTNAAGWLAPINLGGNTNDDIAAESRAEFLWDIFIRDAATGAICTKARNGGSLSPSGTGWFCIPNTNIVGPPTVVSSGSSRLDVFGVTPIGNVQHVFWRGSTWSAPVNLGGNIKGGRVSAVSRKANQLDIFAIGSDDGVWTKAHNGTSWSPSTTGWTSLGGGMLDVESVSWGASRLDVISRTRSYSGHFRYWDGTRWFF